MKPNQIAKKHLDEWNNITGFVEPHTGYYWELLSVMEDAIVQACAVSEMYIESETLPNENMKI